MTGGWANRKRTHRKVRKKKNIKIGARRKK